MDLETLLPETQEPQEAQDPFSSQGPSRSLPQSRDDEWNAYKDEICKVYIKQKNTLEATMQIIEDQGGPKASERTWKSKLKEWNYEKNLTSNDMSILSAKAKKRKNNDGKETVFYHWDSEISKRVERFRKTPKASEIASPSAETPPNIRYETPRPEHQIEIIEIKGDQHSKSPLALDFLPCTESRSLSADHHILEVNSVTLSELDTIIIAGDEIAATFIADPLATNVNWQQDLHFMPDRVAPMSPHPFLPPFSNQGSPLQYFNEFWMGYDFDEAINLDRASLDTSAIRWLDTSLPGSFSAEECQSAWPIFPGASSSIALYDIPWFRFQQWIKTTESLGYSSRINQVFRSSTPIFDMPLISLDLAHSDAELNERCRLLCNLFRSPPDTVDKKILLEFSSKLQELIPQSFDGEIWSKLQFLFHSSNDSPIHELTEFASYFLSNNMLNEEQTDEFLKLAIEKKPKELFRSLFAIKTATVNAFSERILESAARTGNAEILRFFIDCGLDLRYFVGISGGRYLQSALSHNIDTDVPHLLLDNGADVNPPLGEWPYDCPPLYLAAMAGHVEIVNRLLEAGAKVDTKVENETALSCAVVCSCADIVGRLLQAGADVDDGQIDCYGVLDYAYLHEKSIYGILLPKSQKAKTSLTMSGILSAADIGKDALSQYLDGKSGETFRNRKRVLEEVLWHGIAEKQNSDTISVLLEFGVDPNNETISTFATPLALAARNRDINLAGRLLSVGAKIDSRVLAEVARSEDGFDTLNFLIEQGADVAAFGGKALGRAIYSNNLGAIKLLLSSGANINDPSSYVDGYTPLANAAKYAEIKTVKYLVDKGAMVNAPSSVIAEITALQAGAAAGKLEIVKFLLDAGADVNAEPSSRNGTTALEASLDVYKLGEQHAAIFQLLLEKGADINGPRRQRRCEKWNSALVTLITKCASSQLIQLALNAGADVNRRGKGQGARTPLQAAAEVGNLELVKQLLEKRAKINARPSTNYGRTALQAACSGDSPNLELVQYLLKEGAEINAAAGIKRGLTALQGAAIRGHIKIALALLEAGAEVNAEPAEIDGRMALDGAAEHGRLDMVDVLLKFGAKSEVSGDTGFDNAIKLARKNGHFAVAKLLEARSNS